MKKIYLILCAMVIALSANALPEQRMLKSLDDYQKATTQLERKDRSKAVRQKSQQARAPKAIAEDFTVDVVSVDWDYDSYFNEVTYKIFNADSSKVFKFDILLEDGQTDVVPGKTYTLDNMNSWYSYWENPNSPLEYGDFTAASFTKTIAEDGSYTLVASATDDSGDTYNISYEGQPYVAQEFNITIVKTESAFYQESNEVYYQLLDADDLYAFSFDIYLDEDLTDVESGKTYTIADMSDWNSYGYHYSDFSYINYAAASFTKTVAADGSFTIEASVTTPKGDTYNLSYSQGAPTVREESLTLNGTFRQNESVWMLDAADEDSTVYVSLVVYDAFSEGTFTEKEFDSYYTFIAFIGEKVTYYDIVEASITISADGDIYTATGTILTRNEDDPTDQVLFTLNLTATEVEVTTVDDNDDEYPNEADTDFNQIFDSYEFDESDLEEYGSIYVEGLNEDNYYIILDITLPKGATELVAGEYVINDTYGYQTVYSGFYSQLYGVIPSLASQLIEEDGELYYGDIWWIVSGTVTIDEHKNVTVDALNSKGKAIKAVLYGNEEIDDALEQVYSTDKANVRKSIENGRLVIERNGVRYNAVGEIIR